MDLSKAIYVRCAERVSAEDGYEKLIAEPEKQKRNDNLVHVSDDLITVHKKQAHEAQEKWEADPKKETLRHPVQGTARSGVEFADSPGIKKRATGV